MSVSAISPISTAASGGLMAPRPVTSGAARCRERARLNVRSNADWRRHGRAPPAVGVLCCMRRFFFDLMLGNIVKIDPGGMVFECPEATFVVANEMASHLFVWRDDLRGRDACIRVRDTDGREIYRAAVWSENGRRSAGTRRERPGPVLQLRISSARNG